MSNSSPAPKYNCSHVVMLDASGTIVQHGIDNYDLLVKKRPAWKDPFFQNLQAKIEEAYPKYLGVDSSKVLRDATALVRKLQAESLKLLSDFKVEFEVDFSSDKTKKDETLNTLGFKNYYRSASKGDQEALTELLNKFSANMTAALEAEITGKGMDPLIISTLKNNAAPFQQANKIQEKAKGSKTVTSAEAINAFNEIYTTVIGICKIARNDLKDDTVKQKLFSFSRTVKAITGNKGGGDTGTPPANPEPPAK